MTQSRTIIEIFLSSPGEVQSERELITQYAGEWNRLRGRETACHLSILTWQELVAPALGSRSQEVVNAQIGADYDVYLGVFWTRIGTPTGVAESGSIEEFELALERAQEAGHPRIAAVFKKAPIDPSTIDPSQLQKVQTFKERLGQLGAFYREFSDEDSLRNIVNLLFEQLAKDAGADTVTISPKFVGHAKNIRHTAPDIIDEEEDLGLIEVGEKFERQGEMLVERLQLLGDAEVKNTATLQQCVGQMSDLTTVGNLDTKAVKSIVHKSAVGFKELADQYDLSLDELEDVFTEMSRLVEADIRLRLEFSNPDEAAGENIVAMRELASTLATSIDQMDELITSTKQLPPLSSELKKSRNRLGKSREKLKGMLISLRETIENSVEFFEQQSRKDS